MLSLKQTISHDAEASCPEDQWILFAPLCFPNLFSGLRVLISGLNIWRELILSATEA